MGGIKAYVPPYYYDIKEVETVWGDSDKKECTYTTEECKPENGIPF